MTACNREQRRKKNSDEENRKKSNITRMRHIIVYGIGYRKQHHTQQIIMNVFSVKHEFLSSISCIFMQLNPIDRKHIGYNYTPIEFIRDKFNEIFLRPFYNRWSAFYPLSTVICHS